MTNPKDLVGSKKAPLALVPPALIIETSAVMALGAKKYGPYNWRDEAVQERIYLEAMLRHTLAALDGQYLDPESGRPHVAHIAAGAGIVLDAQAHGTLIVNPVKGHAPELLAKLDGSAPRNGDAWGGCGDPNCCPPEPNTEKLEPQASVSIRVPAPEDRLPLTATDYELEQRRKAEDDRG